MGLVEAPDRVGGECLGIPRRKPGGGAVLPARRNRPLEPLQREAVQELRLHVARARAAGERGDLPRG
jgi:hypothetical protein